MTAVAMPGDRAERERALTDLNSTLIVEAAAGSGKTSILAGRVVKLLASNIRPSAIAAITFTELAASELLSRIGEYAAKAAEGKPPKELEAAFPDGVTPAEQQALRAAMSSLDELTCTTIHGFCQRLITPYPVEAGIDPGAKMADEGEAELLFKTVFEEWLREKLDRDEPGSDVIAQLIHEDRGAGLALVSRIAEALQKNPEAQGPAPALTSEVAGDAVSAWKEFRDWYRGTGVEEAEKTGAALLALEEGLGAFLTLVPEEAGFIDLWRLARRELPSQLYTGTGTIRKYQAKKKWEEAVRLHGKSKAEAARLNDEASCLYEAATEKLTRLLGCCSQEAAAKLLPEVREVTDRYRKEKRQAALLDFDDLLARALAMLKSRDEVRSALSERFRHILVDEFQDTDPVQWEILSLLGSETEGEAQQFRPGQLFVVGDPKQSIFRFRDADIRTYTAAREVLGQAGVGEKLEVSANFRSAGDVLKHVNNRFEPVFSGSPIGYRPMEAMIHAACHDAPAVAALDVMNSARNDWRQDEAEAVAELCRRLIGNLPVMRRDGETGLCRAGDIALLSPTGTGLWVYEKALEKKGIPVATQAGKGFYLRQETQDLITLARVLSDGTDTLAFGALMRGPLVGLTEEELLDITHALPPGEEGPAKFCLFTDPDTVTHPLAAQTLRILKSLSRRSRGTTPFDALSEAIAELRVRPLLTQRLGRLAERAIANVDLFLELARPYAVRGLRSFALDQTAAWEEEEREVEGRSDAGDASAQLISIHSAKGLEWSVVILVNAGTQTKGGSGILYNRAEDRLELNIGSVLPPSYEALHESEKDELSGERQRLQYVACTRAKDLLVIPRHSEAKFRANSWAAVVDLGVNDLPAIDIERFSPALAKAPIQTENRQTATQFEQEAMKIVDATRKFTWRKPSEHDGERVEVRSEIGEGDDSQVSEVPEIQGSALRGTVLHKMMEEVLLGVLEESPTALESRARELIGQLGQTAAECAADGLNPEELSTSVRRTLGLAIVREWRSRITPELPVWAMNRSVVGDVAVAGVADAVAWSGEDGAEFVFDWKSDVSPVEATVLQHKEQLREYLRMLGCPCGAVVYMTTGRIVDVAGGASPVVAEGAVDLTRADPTSEESMSH